MWGSVLRCPQAQNTCRGCWPLPGASPFPWPKSCSLGLYIRMFPINYCRGFVGDSEQEREAPGGLRAPELTLPSDTLLFPSLAQTSPAPRQLPEKACKITLTGHPQDVGERAWLGRG